MSALTQLVAAPVNSKIISGERQNLNQHANSESDLLNRSLVGYFSALWYENSPNRCPYIEDLPIEISSARILTWEPLVDP
jgi:hypothetical protein